MSTAILSLRVGRQTETMARLRGYGASLLLLALLADGVVWQYPGLDRAVGLPDVLALLLVMATLPLLIKVRLGWRETLVLGLWFAWQSWQATRTQQEGTFLVLLLVHARNISMVTLFVLVRPNLNLLFWGAVGVSVAGLSFYWLDTLTVAERGAAGFHYRALMRDSPAMVPWLALPIGIGLLALKGNARFVGLGVLWLVVAVVFSRGAVMGLPLVLLLVAGIRKNPRLLVAGLISIGVPLLLTMVISPPGKSRTVVQMYEARFSVSMIGPRERKWEALETLIVQGHGARAVEVRLEASAESTLVQTAYDSGYIGLALWGLLLSLVTIQAIRGSDEILFLWLLLMLVSVYLSLGHALLFWAAVGMVLGQNVREPEGSER